MVEQAERYAEEDRKHREKAERLNNADAVCYQAERTLADYGGKIAEDLRQRIETALRDTRAALSAKDASTARGKAEVLKTVLQQVGRSLYASVQPGAGSHVEPPSGEARPAQLALGYHPDRNKEPGAEERFKEIAEAYAVLNDPQKRAAYDAGGHAGVAGYSPEDLFGGINLQDIFGPDLFGGLGMGGGLFDRMFGRRSGPQPGTNLEMVVQVPLERVLHGGAEAIQIRRPAQCASCKGTGAKAGTQPTNCDTCKGSGKQIRRQGSGAVVIQQISPCPDCDGRGVIIDSPCPDCAGRGQAERVESLTVTIPAGIEDGTALRVAGHGEPSEDAAGRPGDLLVIVATAPDPRFVRRGADLWRDESVSVADAALGSTLTVPTLEGKAAFKLPAGTQPDAALRLHGKGLPRFGEKGRGDLFIRVHVQVPEKLSREERQLYERLRSLATKRAKTKTRSAVDDQPPPPWANT
jgi:molecular chaperone DnaJ